MANLLRTLRTLEFESELTVTQVLLSLASTIVRTTNSISKDRKGVRSYKKDETTYDMKKGIRQLTRLEPGGEDKHMIHF